MNVRRNNAPEVEHDLLREILPDFEPASSTSFVRCLEHEYRASYERWHFHDECELQYIFGGRGGTYVGDYVGEFGPGHLVLTGPRLPHNWITTERPAEGTLRSLAIQFREEPIRQGMQVFHDLEEVKSVLDRARRGIEFFELGDEFRARYFRIKQSKGLERFVEFTSLLRVLAGCHSYRLLSSAPLENSTRDGFETVLNRVFQFVELHYAEELAMSDVCAHVEMTESYFSRYFSKKTGSTFTDFVNRHRINKACELLMASGDFVSSVCYAVGFNNLANFNRRFLEIKGMTPTEFRRQSGARFGGST